MRVRTILVSILGAVLFVAATFSSLAAESAPVLAQYHFRGTAALAGDTNFSRLNKIWSLPTSPEFRDLILQRASKLLAEELTPDNTPARANSAALIRPLLDDMVKSESAAMFVGPDNPHGFALAIKLDKNRSKVWHDGVAGVVQNWNFSPAKKIDRQNYSGQAWTKEQGRWVQLVDAGDWLVVAVGQNSMQAQDSMLQLIRKSGQPVSNLRTNFLDGFIDWPHIKNRAVLDSLSLKPARMQFELSCKADRVRTSVRATYPEAIHWKSQPWQIPTNTIRDPLVSFCAGQKLSTFVATPRQLTELSVNPLNDQFFIWAQSEMLFQTYAAIPAKNAPTILTNLATQLPRTFNPLLKDDKRGELRWTPERAEIIWQGIQLMVPALSAIKERAGEFLLAACFPLGRHKDPFPAELLTQFRGRTDLLYYDWEYTNLRLTQWRFLSDLVPVLSRGSAVSNDLAVVAAGKGVMPARNPFIVKEKWLDTIAPFLENSVTEVTATGANELTLVRKSNLGLTGFELVALTRLIGGTSAGLPAAPVKPPSKPATPKTPAKPSK